MAQIGAQKVHLQKLQALFQDLLLEIPADDKDGPRIAKRKKFESEMSQLIPA